YRALSANAVKPDRTRFGKTCISGPTDRLPEVAMTCPRCAQKNPDTAVNCSSCNQQFADPEAVSNGKLDTWRQFIGPHADYYLERFRSFQAANGKHFRTSWHWPAF